MPARNTWIFTVHVKLLFCKPLGSPDLISTRSPCHFLSISYSFLALETDAGQQELKGVEFLVSLFDGTVRLNVAGDVETDLIHQRDGICFLSGGHIPSILSDHICKLWFVHQLQHTLRENQVYKLHIKKFKTGKLQNGINAILSRCDVYFSNAICKNTYYMLRRKVSYVEYLKNRLIQKKFRKIKFINSLFGFHVPMCDSMLTSEGHVSVRIVIQVNTDIVSVMYVLYIPARWSWPYILCTGLLDVTAERVLPSSTCAARSPHWAAPLESCRTDASDRATGTYQLHTEPHRRSHATAWTQWKNFK